MLRPPCGDRCPARFEEDIQEEENLHNELRGLAAEVAATARRECLSGSVVTLKIRFVGFETHTRQHKPSLHC